MKHARQWLSTLPVLLLLVAAVVQGTGEKLHAQLLIYGEETWPGYAGLRVDPVKPECDPESYVAGAAQQEAEPKTEDEELLDDLLEDVDVDEPPGEADAGAGADAAGADAGGAAEADAGATNEAAGEDDEELFGDDLIDEIAGVDEGESDQPSTAAIEAARKACIARHEAFAQRMDRLTPGLKRYRGVEMGVASTVEYGVSYTRHLLVLLLLISAATATGIRAHIALRPPRSVLDHRVAQGGQLIANLLLFASWYAHWRIDQAAGLVVQHPILPVLWMAGFAVMILLNVALIARPPANATPGGTLGHAMLAVPLYASMAMIAGGYFLFAEGHPSGLAIYLTKLTEHSTLYIFVGLYVWVGMLLKGTRLARLAFDVVRPWRLPAELLAVLVVVVAAVPTAYSGASGIFVMATAAIIFEELMRAGARKNLALAATAMSGGLGVVLNPCLLVVIVASLNKEVTTDQIYGWGTLIFGATAAVLLLGALIAARRKFVKPNVGEAASESGRVLLYLLPYVLIGGAVLLVYGLGLDTGLDEHSAPTVLPVVLLSLLVYDRIVARRRSPLPDEPGVLTTVSAASRETSTQIGALLLLMGLSVCLGGIVERGDLMSVLPALGSPIAMMVLLVAVLVVIGMTMDPYGAVILVSASIARLAYDSGIDPLHFWLTVLVAFELGYLTPPVALNHLLVRQVVDTDAIPEDTGPRASYWRRHEQTLLPVVIMGTRLLIVAFLPFFW